MSDYCAAPAWIERMSAARPFDSAAAVLAAADKASEGLRRDGLAGSVSPSSANRRTNRRARSVGDRAGLVCGRADGVAVARSPGNPRLADANHAYEERFGHVFIVCAAGKTASEMLSLLASG